MEVELLELTFVAKVGSQELKFQEMSSLGN